MNQVSKNNGSIMGMSLRTPEGLIVKKDKAFDFSSKVFQGRLVLMVALCLSAMSAMAQIPAAPTSVTAATA